MLDGVTVPCRENLPALPQVIAGANPPEIERRVENFFHSVANIFEAWVYRRKSVHTQPAYRGDVMAFVEFGGWTCRRTVRSYYTAYFQLRERVNSAVRVPFREVQLNGEEPRLNDCHRNMDCGVKNHPETCAGMAVLATQ